MWATTAAAFQVALAIAIGIPLAALVPPLLGRMRRPAILVVVLAGCYIAAFAGLILVAGQAVWVFSALIGIGTGAFPLALTSIALRARTSMATTSLSAFTQCVGYLIASVGPFVYVHVGSQRCRPGPRGLGWGVTCVSTASSGLVAIYARTSGFVSCSPLSRWAVRICEVEVAGVGRGCPGPAPRAAVADAGGGGCVRAGSAGRVRPGPRVGGHFRRHDPGRCGRRGRVAGLVRPAVVGDHGQGCRRVLRSVPAGSHAGDESAEGCGALGVFRVPGAAAQTEHPCRDGVRGGVAVGRGEPAAWGRSCQVAYPAGAA